MHGSCHDVAPAGCSCRKYQPPRICSRYSRQQKSMCTIASLILLFHSSCVPLNLCLFTCCQELNIVHIGDPMRIIGLVSSKSFAAAILRSGFEKSYVSPFSSVVVRFSAHAPSNPNSPATLHQATLRFSPRHNADVHKRGGTKKIRDCLRIPLGRGTRNWETSWNRTICMRFQAESQEFARRWTR